VNIGDLIMPTKFCRNCKKDRACDNYHAYIIELDRSVLDETSGFDYDGDLPPDKKVFYVGETNHSIECRYHQHTAPRPNDNQYNCTCNLGVNPTNKTVRRKFPRRVKYVNGKGGRRLFAKGLFAPSSFGLGPEYDNPTVMKTTGAYPGSAKKDKTRSQEIEREIRDKLRSMGHAAYCN